MQPGMTITFEDNCGIERTGTVVSADKKLIKVRYEDNGAMVTTVIDDRQIVREDKVEQATVHVE